MAAISSTDVTPAEMTGPEIYAYVARALGAETVNRLQALAHMSHIDEEETCWVEQQLTGACAKLPSPHDRLWAREYARQKAASRPDDYSFLKQGFAGLGSH